nr:connexin 52.9 [Danio rerio]
MGDWNFLGGILEEVHIHSTMVGKIWLTILFIFRMLVLGVAAEDVWNDEQSDFICNTEQPGCRNVCYDQAFPVSLIRYWVLQVIFVSSPSLVYMGHAIYKLRALEKQRHCQRVTLRRELETVEPELMETRRRIERELRQLEQGKLNKAPLRGSLLRTYLAHVLTRCVLEVCFMMCQYLLYGHRLQPLYKCDRQPCPNVVDCFVSRPTEKSLFMVFMQGIAAVSLFLSLLELLHLAYKKLKKGLRDHCPALRDGPADSSAPNRNSVGQQARKATMPMALSGYTALLEKQGNGPTYPSVIHPLSAFVPIQGPSAPDMENRDALRSPLEHNSSNNTSSGSRSPLVQERGPAASPSDSHALPQTDSLPLMATLPLTDPLPQMDVFPLRDASSCPAVLHKQRRVSPPWNCSTVMESTGSDSGDSSSGGLSQGRRTRCGRSVSRSDLRLTPDSQPHCAAESPSLSPQRQRPAIGSSRRADLQI